MNKKVFHFGLFKEGIRQSKIIGLLGLISILAFTALIWFGCLISQLEYGDASTEIYQFYEIGSVLIAQQYIFAPFMVLHLFRYLNQRNASDFYHAIPHSREALHVSFFCSVQFWNILTTLATALLILVLYGLSPLMTINGPTVLPYLLNTFAAQFLISSAVLLAMSITGTTFSNLSVALMIIFVPRIFLTAITTMVESFCVIVNIKDSLFLFDSSINVAAGFPISLFSSANEVVSCFTNPFSGLYTLVFGLLYFGLALFLLHRRPSETAGKSSTTRFLQAVYRITFGALLGLIPTAIVYDCLAYGYDWDFERTMVVLVCLLAIGLCYFVFELLSTKQAKNLVHAIPGFFIFLLIDALVLGASMGISQQLISYEPSADELTGITLSDNAQDNYFTQKAGSITLTDPTAKKLAIQALAETVKGVKEDHISRDPYDNNLYMDSAYSYSASITTDGGTVDIIGEEKRTFRVGFCEKGKTVYRYVLVGEDAYTALLEILEQQPTYKDCFYDFPQQGEETFTTEFYGFADDSNDSSVTSDQTEQLYECLRKEIADLPFETWHPMAVSGTSESPSILGIMDVEVATTTDNISFSIPVDTTLFPKTTQLFAQFYNQNHPDAIQKVTDALTTLSENGTLWEDYEVFVYWMGEIIDGDYYEYLDISDEEDIASLIECMKKATPLTTDSTKVMIGIQCYDYVNNPPISPYALFSMDKQDLQPIIEKELMEE